MSASSKGSGGEHEVMDILTAQAEIAGELAEALRASIAAMCRECGAKYFRHCGCAEVQRYRSILARYDALASTGDNNANSDPA